MTKKSWFIILFLIVYKIPYLQLKDSYKKHVQQIKYEFPLWYRQVQALLQTQTVYNALLLSAAFAPKLIKVNLDKLLIALEKDPLNYDLYADFMKTYDLYEIERSMKQLYRFNTMTKIEISNAIKEEANRDEEMISKARRNKMLGQISKYAFLNFIPMLSVSFLFIFMMSLVFKAMMEGGG